MFVKQDFGAQSPFNFFEEQVDMQYPSLPGQFVPDQFPETTGSAWGDQVDFSQEDPEMIFGQDVYNSDPEMRQNFLLYSLINQQAQENAKEPQMTTPMTPFTEHEDKPTPASPQIYEKIPTLFPPTIYPEFAGKTALPLGKQFETEIPNGLSDESNNMSQSKAKNGRKDVFLQKLQHGRMKKPRKINEQKNIHRYMTRQIIRALVGEDFRPLVKELCQQEGICYTKVSSYFLGEIENFTSLAFLREHWMTQTQEENNSQENSRARVFRRFTKWFLKERAIRYILKGNMKNKKEYIRYKNHVMLHYVDKPQKYIMNKSVVHKS